MRLKLGAPWCAQETEEERSLRTRVFVDGAFRWYVSVIGYVVFFVVGCIAIPKIFAPVKVRPPLEGDVCQVLGLESCSWAGICFRLSSTAHKSGSDPCEAGIAAAG